ncbi:helix-turn-helix domain-containing protein [Dermabacter sp. HSID17554]|uniref:helix-turn-helix domain-containing protein n=1 Tax=Dermabacter sp. HSID17554 TaxID=2419511 RepID=UPI000F8601EB|nr:helix-turn-helix transcriptional regulator [Dermabacter sp. HSID17554]RUP86726.1 XRE family transcriptional regulator [Dermabacter sp. HSID17554]
MATGKRSVGEFGTQVARILSEAYREQGVTLKTIEARSGVNYSTVSRMLAGTKVIPLDEFVALCHALNLHPLDVLEQADSALIRDSLALAAHETPNTGAAVRDKLDHEAETPETFYDGDDAA